ncbi:MAG TPA: flippase activity-associated protein Agl23 [Pyrinomonadaceae bacterium]|nr:flippase activity-associated protein Agl23 [Pyrinomonadaceae bacterium]
MANTASTKSGSGKKAQVRSIPAKNAPQVEPPADLSERAWFIGVVVIFVIAAVLRLYDLNLVPLHHDEGVNGNFLLQLVRDGRYNYDPENYHGPTLYYFAAFFPWLVRMLFGKAAMENYGLTTVAIRMVPALFGLATIWLIFLLRRWLGSVATLSAALLLAISPGAVYLSRYFIHETHFVFFTFAIVVSCLYLYENRNPVYLIPAAASAALLFATKETAFISVGVLIIALAMTFGYLLLRRGKVRPPQAKGRPQPEVWSLTDFIDDLGGPLLTGLCVVLAAITFAGLYYLFYTSFTKNPKGLWDSFQTFAIWKRTSDLAHVHPIYTYVDWMLKREGALLLLGSLGALFIVVKPKNAFALFSALWAFGLMAAYSLIGYKTPWLMLSFIVPLTLIAGYAVQAIYEMDGRQWRVTSVVLFLVVSFTAYQSFDLNFINYDNDDQRYVYVYAHTTRGILDLVKEIDRIGNERGGGQTGITIVSPDYWPLPWYLRGYSRVGYYGRMAPSIEPLIVANVNQQPEIDANFSQFYQQVRSNQQDGTFELRPGVKLLLYERRKDAVVTEPPAIIK